MLPMVTERIVLRDWSLADLERYAYWLQSGLRWQELDGPYYPKPTASEVAEIIARLREEITTGSVADPYKTTIHFITCLKIIQSQTTRMATSSRKHDAIL